MRSQSDEGDARDEVRGSDVSVTVRATAAIAAVALSGCIATRYSPALDGELTDSGLRFLESRSVVVQETEAPGDILDDSLARSVAEPLGTITVLHNRSSFPGRGFQCFEPMLYVLTVGVIPADCTNDYEFEAVLDEGGSTTPLRLTYTVTNVQGWVSGFLVLLPAWDLGFGERPSRRAFNTLVNRAAHEAEQR